MKSISRKFQKYIYFLGSEQRFKQGIDQLALKAMPSSSNISTSEYLM